MKWIVMLAIAGHILTGWTDCLMTFTPAGRFSFAIMRDADKMAKTFEGMPLKRLIQAIVFGVIGLTLCFFGYMGLTRWMYPYADTTIAHLMYIGAVLLYLPGIAHHVICGVAEWFFVRLGRTESALQAVIEFFGKTSITMYLCYAGCLLYSAALFIGIISGGTELPAWSCVLNPALLTILLFALKVPAATNVGGAIAFLSIVFLI